MVTASAVPDPSSAQNSLLFTKLFLPRARPNFVLRPRLNKLLNQSLIYDVSLVSAPAGFGKTSLLSDWVRQNNDPTAWLSLDEEDNDPARFLTYLVAAIETLPAIRQGQITLSSNLKSLIESSNPLPVEAILTLLVNSLVALPDDFILLLDDYHLIRSQAVHQALSFLIDNLPPQMHLMIATRSDPPLPLARLRAHGRLTEIRAEDLRFTQEEAAHFFEKTHQQALSDLEITALRERTEGWIAGLQMVAISLQASNDSQVSKFVEDFTGSHNFVADYLAEEVLRQQPADIQNFLLRTAFLKRFSVSLCDAVVYDDQADSQTSQKILEALEQANLFLISLDEQRHWYRYHHLFAEFLQTRLRQDGEAEIKRLHHRAGTWYKANGLTEEAIAYFLKAQNWSEVTELIYQVGHKKIYEAKFGVLRTWLTAIPQEVLEKDLTLCLWYTLTLVMTGYIKTSLRIMARIEQLWAQHQDPVILGRILSIKAVQRRMQFKIPEALELAQRALSVMTEDESVFYRRLAWLALSTAYRMSGEVDKTLQTLETFFELDQEVVEAYFPNEVKEGQPLVYGAVAAWHQQGVMLRLAGRLTESVEVLEKLIERSGQTLGLRSGMSGIELSEIFYLRNDLDKAEAWARQSIHDLRLVENKPRWLPAYLALGKVMWALGKRQQALSAFETGLEMAQDLGGHVIMGMAKAVWVRVWLSEGNLVAIANWVVERGLRPDYQPTYLEQAEYLMFVRALLAQGKPDEAHHLLKYLIDHAERAGRTQDVIEMMALKALTFQLENATDHALTVIGRVLFLAEPENFIRIFVDEGPAMADLLRKAANRGFSPDYVRRLLACFDEGRTLVVTIPQTLADPISQRELEVLRLVAQGATNAEIADEIVVTVNTVKKHVTNLFRKLSVSARDQAATRAQTLGLL